MTPFHIASGLVLGLAVICVLDREREARAHTGREQISEWLCRVLIQTCFRWARLWWCLACAVEAFITVWYSEHQQPLPGEDNQ